MGYRILRGALIPGGRRGVNLLVSRVFNQTSLNLLGMFDYCAFVIVQEGNTVIKLPAKGTATAVRTVAL